MHGIKDVDGTTKARCSSSLLDWGRQQRVEGMAQVRVGCYCKEQMCEGYPPPA